ncbi:transcriptional activator RfaH [Rhodomicrobium vannielii ATCC 17100]|uniref:transcriptional activator RfaH n=1 Tax=Rhodomicrobium vannielii TaxID=1069 RepID=UPI001919CDF4|nr:transcriptional activator RfaH [Rhodomicrobium vannielii]MBJ7533231.1 transcriptional activator RfaH [Rhodomicrobium vannielii ATCC 17100]
MLLPVTSKWIVLTTHPHRESFAVENLARQAFVAYCPMTVKQVRHARRAYDAPRPLFPGYVFVEHQSAFQYLRPILGTYGVRSILRIGDSPAVLPVGFVESLKAREMDGVISKPEALLRAGQTVTISGGPFDGLVGQILEFRERDRILLLLDLLNQQTKVQVEAKMLRAT